MTGRLKRLGITPRQLAFTLRGHTPSDPSWDWEKLAAEALAWFNSQDDVTMQGLIAEARSAHPEVFAC